MRIQRKEHRTDHRSSLCVLVFLVFFIAFMVLNQLSQVTTLIPRSRCTTIMWKT